MKLGPWCGLVLVSLIALATALPACGSKSRAGATPPAPGPAPAGTPLALADAPLAVTEPEKSWQLNVVGATSGAPASVTRTFTFAPSGDGALAYGYQEQDTQNCGTPFTSTVTLHDVADAPTVVRTVQLEDCFDYTAGHTYRLTVALANPGRCAGLSLTLGFLHQQACAPQN